MDPNAIINPQPSLFVSRYRGRLCFAVHDTDDVVAGWVTSFLQGVVLVWNVEKNQHEILAQYILN